MNIFRKLMFKHRLRRLCKSNGYNCPECIHHEFVFDGIKFEGIRCKAEARAELEG